MANHLRITNDQRTAITVWLEPWGRDYTLLPGEAYSFTATTAAEDFYFNAFWQERDILLYAEGGCEDVEVWCGDLELACGHNREHRTDRTF